MSTEEKSRYFTERTLNLLRNGFTAGPEADGMLPVEQDGRHLYTSTDESQPTMKWNDRCAPQAKYRVEKRILSDSNARPEQITNAVLWLTQAAEQGNQYAQYFLDCMNDASALLTSAPRLLHHVGRIFQEQAPPPAGGIFFVDSKLMYQIICGMRMQYGGWQTRGLSVAIRTAASSQIRILPGSKWF